MAKNTMPAILVGAMLASCVTYHEPSPYAGPVAPPQVAYRIDAHRYFEIVPRENFACLHASFFYVDTSRDIRTQVTSWDRIAWGKLYVDAANDEYLISPIIFIDPFECQSGDTRSIGACNSRLRYSVDAGRTWNVVASGMIHANRDVYLTGDTVYHAGLKARLPDLVKGDSAWSAFPSSRNDRMPPLAKPPIDDEPRCDKSKTIKE